MAHPLLAPVLGFLGRLSYPRLFLVTAILFVLDLLVPDLIPLADEILLGLASLLLANFRKRKQPGRTDAIDGESRR